MSNDIMKLIDKKMRLVESDLEKISETAMVDLVEDELQGSIAKNLYGRPESDVYDRTGATFQSVKGSSNKVKDTIIITAITDLNNTLPRHSSWVKTNTTTVDDFLDEWLEYGHGGLASYEGNLMFEDAQQNVNRKGKKLLKSKLTSLGYKVKG